MPTMKCIIFQKRCKALIKMHIFQITGFSFFSCLKKIGNQYQANIIHHLSA